MIGDCNIEHSLCLFLTIDLHLTLFRVSRKIKIVFLMMLVSELRTLLEHYKALEVLYNDDMIEISGIEFYQRFYVKTQFIIKASNKVK